MSPTPRKTSPVEPIKNSHIPHRSGLGVSDSVRADVDAAAAAKQPSTYGLWSRSSAVRTFPPPSSAFLRLPQPPTPDLPPPFSRPQPPLMSLLTRSPVLKRHLPCLNSGGSSALSWRNVAFIFATSWARLKPRSSYFKFFPIGIGYGFLRMLYLSSILGTSLWRSSSMKSHVHPVPTNGITTWGESGLFSR